MGAVKTKADEILVDNGNGGITPTKHKEIIDVIDNQIEGLRTDIDNLPTQQGTTLPTSEQDGELLTYVAGELDWVLPSELQLCEKGGFAMNGNIDMQGNELKNPRITDSHSDSYYNNNIIFFEPDAENDTFVANAPFSYTEDFSDELSDLQIPPKKYVDSKLPVSVLADLSNGSITVPCPYTLPNGISTVISHIDVIFYNEAGNQITSYSYLKINTIERTVGLNPVYTITVDVSQPQAGKVQVLFTSASLQSYEPVGGGSPVGGID